MHDDLTGIAIKFNQDALNLLNFVLAFIMFGVALSLRAKDFRNLITYPKSALFGLLSQYLALPLITILLVYLLKPHPVLGLGMILVAACPGGNVSNFFTFLAKGNVALSVALSMVSTIAAFLLTPFQLQFWGSFNSDTAALLQEVNLSPLKTMKVVAIILVVPVLLGMWFSAKFPKLTLKIQKPVKVLSFLLLIGIIVGGLMANWSLFLEHYSKVVFLVLAHNSAALAVAFAIGLLSGIGRAATKTITIETAIQNSGLGLVLIFNFFDGNGGMAIITAWWGIWHIISGFVVSQLFRKFYPS